MNRLLTLFLALSLIFAVVDVDAHLDTPRARNVSPHRMIKKRAGALGGVLGTTDGTAPPENVAAAPGDAETASAGTPANTAGATSAATRATVAAPSASASQSGNTAGVATKAASSTASAQATDGGLLGPIIPIIGGPVVATNASNTVTPIVNVTSATSATSTTPIASTTNTLSSTSSLPASSTDTPGASIVTVTTPAAAEQSSQDSSPPPQGATKIQRNTIIILAAIGGSIALAGVIWTIIRKWKFRPSSSFEDRMQPIDWQPTHEDHNSRDITEKLNRNPSVRSHGSFTSGNGHQDAGLIADLPPIDHTSGPAHLAPIGGYADLHRGPSPQPHPDYRAASPYQYEIPNPPGYGQPQYYGGAQAGYQAQAQGGGYEPYPQQRGY